MRNFLIMKCEPLNDQWECDADRTPLCVVQKNNIPKKYQKYGYEIYEIFPNGSITQRTNYEDFD
jgi:hypothetical protein